MENPGCLDLLLPGFFSQLDWEGNVISGFWAESLAQKEEIEEGPNCCELGPRAASLFAPGTGQQTCVWDLEGTGIEGAVSKAADAI